VTAICQFLAKEILTDIIFVFMDFVRRKKFLMKQQDFRELTLLPSSADIEYNVI